ncbi:MAG: phosphate signaling complex protein PhoU [Betaproteobacteria bacterium]|nr:phosphate signaling complex protein PhoU [Betaproteobacteria bacterium]
MDNLPHTNPAYDREMAKMERLLRGMEDALRGQMADIETAFTDMDLPRARDVWRNDLRLNEMEGRALKQAIAVLACYQPVAEDLRKVVGALYAAAEYERIGDYIKNFAKSVESFISHEETLKVFPMLLAMVRRVRGQFDEYLSAVTAEDLDAAVAVWRRDTEIDAVFREAVNAAAENQAAGDGNAHSLVQAISIASNLERLGDRIKNLVEIFYYRKSGRQLEADMRDSKIRG